VVNEQDAGVIAQFRPNAERVELSISSLPGFTNGHGWNFPFLIQGFEVNVQVPYITPLSRLLVGFAGKAQSFNRVLGTVRIPVYIGRVKLHDDLDILGCVEAHKVLWNSETTQTWPHVA
jgi:hypothetical protein